MKCKILSQCSFAMFLQCIKYLSFVNKSSDAYGYPLCYFNKLIHIQKYFLLLPIMPNPSPDYLYPKICSKIRLLPKLYRDWNPKLTDYNFFNKSYSLTEPREKFVSTLIDKCYPWSLIYKLIHSNYFSI